MGTRTVPIRPILLLWLIVSAALIWSGWHNITTLGGFDPDDKLRLVQLRDFLAGQSWFDVTQYRMNAPQGAPMHWSRLIELPLAAFIIPLKPLVGQHVAEMIAGSVVPLLLLGWITYMLAQIATRIASREAGIVAAMITLSSSAVLMQLRPMRIDHHGWQIAMAVLALSTMFWSNSRSAGRVLGIALAIWLHISLEGAPMTAAFFLLLGWRWIFDRTQAPRLFWTVLVFSATSLLLFLGTQAHGLWAPTFCDTVSPPHIAAIAFAVAVIIPAILFLPVDWRVRMAAAAVAGGGALVILLALAPQCAGGAFGNLDPIVREYWYSKVSEGLPIWHQSWRSAIVLIAGPLCGAFAWLMLARKIKGDERKRLMTIGFFLAYALLLSVVVIRTVSVASAYAIPVTAVLIASLFKKYRRSQVPARRIGLVAGMLALLIPGAVVVGLLSAIPDKAAAANKPKADGKPSVSESCESVESVTALAALPKARFVAPFDMGPTILMATPDEVLASSHHRNEKAMHDHIQIFRLPPEASSALIKKHGITHIAACPTEGEMQFYAKKDPAGLWAQLKKRQVPAWLEPMPDMGHGIKVWRVR